MNNSLKNVDFKYHRNLELNLSPPTRRTIVSQCEKLVQKEHKRRHDNVARIVHWKLCGKYNLKRSEKWYEHAPEGVVENEEVKILWDVMIECDRDHEKKTRYCCSE